MVVGMRRVSTGSGGRRRVKRGKGSGDEGRIRGIVSGRGGIDIVTVTGIGITRGRDHRSGGGTDRGAEKGRGGEEIMRSVRGAGTGSTSVDGVRPGHRTKDGGIETIDELRSRRLVWMHCYTLGAETWTK